MYKQGDIIAGEYAVSHVFTNGGMGVVYKVHRSGWDVDMAMKCPRAELFENEAQRKGFIRECETWMKLGSHPNIISCYYIKNIDAVPSVFMEYADGGSLLDCIASGRLYDGSPDKALRRIVDIAIQASRGLFHAHQKGYVHQDVKPANVLLTASGVAKVSDFGLSKAKGTMCKSAFAADGRSLVVSSGGWTPAYGSPEQALGRPLTRRTDVWSWAVMILEMIHGELFWKSGPFAARALRQLWPWQVFSPRVKSSKGLVKILRECLEEQEEKRPKDFDVVEAKLLALYYDTFGEEYPRKTPPDVLMAETTLCNRIASYAELESGDKNRFGEVLDCLKELHAISPWTIWGDLNYAVYSIRHGRPIDKVRRMVENQLRHANTDQEKEWLLNLLLSTGVSDTRDPLITLLRIEGNNRLKGKVKRVHELIRSRLEEVFQYEMVRHYVEERCDIYDRDCVYGVSESGTVQIRAERKIVGGKDCCLYAVVTMQDREYNFSEEYLPRDSRIAFATTDDRGRKISLWIWIPSHGLYQKVFGLENGQQISYHFNYNEEIDWSCGFGDVPVGIYISGDARLIMLRYQGRFCSVWQNDKCNDGDGHNICVVDLADYGLIPPELMLPKLRLEKGFEYGVSANTAYRLMRTLSQIYGQKPIPCHIARPESSDSEMERSFECSSLLERANLALKNGTMFQLNECLSQCIQKGVLPHERLLNAHQNDVTKTNEARPVTGWYVDTLDNTLIAQGFCL